MENLASHLAELERHLGALVEPALRDGAIEMAGDDEITEVVRTAAAVIRRAEAVLVESAGVVADRSARALGAERMTARAGCRNVTEYLTRATRFSQRTVHDFVRSADAVRRERSITSGELLPAPFPELREAMVSGVVGTDGVVGVSQPLKVALRVAGDADRSLADDFLTAHARGHHDGDTYVAGEEWRAELGPPMGADELRALARSVADRLDPDGAEPIDERAMRHRGVRLGRARDGLVPISGRLMPEVAGGLERIIDSLLSPSSVGPRFPSAGAGVDADGDSSTDASAGCRAEPGSPGHESCSPTMPCLRECDTRSREQLQHDALGVVVETAARSGTLPTIGGAPPTLVVRVTEGELLTGRGSARIEGIDERVPIAVAARIACTGVIQRVTQSRAGRIVGIEIIDRVFNAHQRRAIALRDEECVIPGCRVKAAWCEIHHVHEHALGGPTSTDNGVLLCFFHHRSLHEHGWAVRIRDGLPEVRGPAAWDPTRSWRPAKRAEPPPELSRRVARPFGTVLHCSAPRGETQTIAAPLGDSWPGNGLHCDGRPDEALLSDGRPDERRRGDAMAVEVPPGKAPPGEVRCSKVPRTVPPFDEHGQVIGTRGDRRFGDGPHGVEPPSARNRPRATPPPSRTPVRRPTTTGPPRRIGP